MAPRAKPPSATARRAARETVEAARKKAPPERRRSDPLTGELHKREVLPLLVLHFIESGPSYGNQLMERISEMTAGVLAVNPNTMYPLLRRLESDGLIKGEWEHPERRSRRFYSITRKGRAEYRRLLEDSRPFLDALATSLQQIVEEIYG